MGLVLVRLVILHYFSARCWKVLELFRLWCGRQTQWCRCRCQNSRVNNRETFSDNLSAISQWCLGKVREIFVTKRVATLKLETVISDLPQRLA